MSSMGMGRRACGKFNAGALLLRLALGASAASWSAIALAQPNAREGPAGGADGDPPEGPPVCTHKDAKTAAPSLNGTSSTRRCPC